MATKYMLFIKKEEVTVIQEDITKVTELMSKGFKLLLTTTDDKLQLSSAFNLISYEEAIKTQKSKARTIFEIVKEEMDK